MTATYCVSCTDRRSGKIGSFIIEPGSPSGAFRALSPVFDNLFGLYDWMQKNGWTTSHATGAWNCKRK